ncbi:MAG: hypothetical protein SFV17_05940 [Candidatus Obscuribacter sp.]|nr:hypothetical protein [Candidatus Melainabacteria bacterium]MDX1986207.1 hypothetical protein [Candidatus Obscuribacter sp.]
MKQPGTAVINPAIFSFTLYRKFENARYLIPLVLIMLLPAFMVTMNHLYFGSATTVEMQKEQALSMVRFFCNPSLCFILSYLFVSEAFVNNKAVGDAETLSLLFTRPINRFSYVLTKFLAGTAGASLILIFAALLAYLTALAFGIAPIPLDPLLLLTILLNTAGSTAFFVFLHCLPGIFAISAYFVLLGCAGMGNGFSSIPNGSESNAMLDLIKNIILTIHYWCGDFLPTSINLQTLFAAEGIDYLELGVAVTNIFIFLYLAAQSLCARELSYGAD